MYSNQICETCFNLARDLATFRTKLLENQQKLEEAFKNLEDVKSRKQKIALESDDDNPPEIPFVMSLEDAEELTVKVEQMSEDEDQFDFDKLERNKDMKLENQSSDEEAERSFEFMRKFFGFFFLIKLKLIKISFHQMTGPNTHNRH